MRMRFDPESPRDIARLRQAMIWSERRMRGYRMEVVDSLREFVGFHYGDGGSGDKVPINLIALGVETFQQSLLSGTPQVIVESRYPELKPGAADLELVTNYQVKQMDLAGSLTSAVIAALFGWGILKIGVAVDDILPDEGGFLHDTGQVFCDLVLIEDFVVDMMAKRWEQCSFIGNHFRVPLDWARDNPLYNKAAREALSAKTPMIYDTDRGGNAIRSESISQGSGPLYDEFRDRTELVEIWLPEDNIVVTIPGDSDNRVLRVADWKGPKTGPYKRLGFGEVMGNLMPKSPVGSWKDLHQAANNIMNKVVRQAERQKTITGVPGHAKEDGSRVLEADDGQMILIENPGDVKEFTTGGPNQASLGMVLWTRDLWSFLAGNIEVLGGLAPQTKTVGQDKLLNANASGKIKMMQQAVMDFVKECCHDIAWHIWHDPMIHIPFNKTVPGTNISLAKTFTPESRKGEFFDYTFDIDPYSIQDLSPSERAAALLEFVTQIYPAIAPGMQQSGTNVDWDKLLRLLAKYQQLPELEDILVFQQNQQEGAPPGAQQTPASMAPSTTRNYVRQNVSQDTAGKRKDMVMRMLTGGGGQMGAQPGATLAPQPQ